MVYLSPLFYWPVSCTSFIQVLRNYNSYQTNIRQISEKVGKLFDVTRIGASMLPSFYSGNKIRSKSFADHPFQFLLLLFFMNIFFEDHCPQYASTKHMIWPLYSKSIGPLILLLSCSCLFLYTLPHSSQQNLFRVIRLSL